VEDAELVASTLAGDSAAYLTLTGRHAGLAAAAAYTYTKDIEAAEEVAVAALSLAYTRLGVEEERCNVPLLIMKSVRAAYKGWKRGRRKPTGPRVVSWGKVMEEEQAQTPRQERLFDSMRRVRETVNRLPTKQRMVVNLRFLATLSYNHIAKAMGTKPEKVSALLAAAAVTVRKELMDLEPREWD